MLEAFDVPLSWTEIGKRTVRETIADDCLGLAAQLAYYFFLALFPAILFLLALASFFSLNQFADAIVPALRPFAPEDIVTFLQDQLQRISNSDSGGLMTLGFLGALWSSSAATVAIVSSLNRAYDIEESRPWWKVRLLAIGLTFGLALFVLSSFALLLAGPALAGYLASVFGFGETFALAWTILQWPLIFFLVSTGIGTVYYFAPDADQDWVWVTPGAVAATLLWFAISVLFKVYIANFTDYNAAYGAVGAAIIMLLWFYVSSLAILTGAEMNAEIEQASPYGKAPGEKVPGQRRKIGVAAARAYKARLNRSLPPDSNLSRTRWTMNTREQTDHRTLGELFTELSEHVRALIQQEVRLAKVELGEKLSLFGRHAALIAAGALLAYAGVLMIGAGLVLALIAMGLPPWLGAFAGAALTLALGYLLIKAGISALQRNTMTPNRTIQTFKETAQWAKGQS